MRYIIDMLRSMAAAAMLCGAMLPAAAQEQGTPSATEEIEIPGYNKGLVPGDKIPDSYLDMELPLMDPLPDGRTTVKLRDFKGKLLILDFWSIGCPSCIAAFPKVEALQEKFGDRIALFVVNRESKERILKGDRAYKPFRMSVLPALSEESSRNLVELFPHRTVPHHVWIDAEGKVAAVTNGYNTNEEFIEAFLQGKIVKMNRKADFNPRKVFFEENRSLLSLASAPDISARQGFYSFLMRYSDILSGTHIIVAEKKDSASRTIRNTYTNCSVLTLYRNAFSGKDRFYTANFGRHYLVDNMIELRVKNAGAFTSPEPYKDPHGADEWYRKWHFSYEQVYPFADSAKRFEYMQQDLNRYFGSLMGIKGSIEKQRVKCLVLVRTSKQDKLSPPQGDNGPAKQVFIADASKTRQFLRYNIKAIASTLQYENKSFLKDVPTPFLVETDGIEKVNMKIIVKHPSLASLRKELQRYDLDIIEAEREIARLVISEIE